MEEEEEEEPSILVNTDWDGFRKQGPTGERDSRLQGNGDKGEGPGGGAPNRDDA